MLHIKDIEAFARINEALSENAKDTDTGTSGITETTAHPAMVLAMVATGRLPMSALPKAEPGAAPLLPWGRPNKPR